MACLGKLYRLGKQVQSNARGFQAKRTFKCRVRGQSTENSTWRISRGIYRQLADHLKERGHIAGDDMRNE